MHDVKAIVVDRSEQCDFSLEKNKIGELLLKSDTVAIGYLNKRCDNVIQIKDENGYHATGDLAKLHKNGWCYVRRLTNVVKMACDKYINLEMVKNTSE